MRPWPGWTATTSGKPGAERRLSWVWYGVQPCRRKASSTVASHAFSVTRKDAPADVFPPWRFDSDDAGRADALRVSVGRASDCAAFWALMPRTTKRRPMTLRVIECERTNAPAQRSLPGARHQKG